MATVTPHTEMINDLLKRGARRSRLQAKVFGGGNVLSGFYSDPIGTRNAAFVLEYLAAERIPVGDPFADTTQIGPINNARQ